MTGFTSFLRRCVSTPLNTVITAVIVVWIAATLPGLVRWALIDAVWTGSSPRACTDINAACWLFIRERMGQILVGAYPAAEQWRVVTCGILGVAGLLALAIPWRRHKLLAGFGFTILFPVFAGVILRGGVFGLVPVPTAQWGGILLTVVIATWTIASSLPIGFALALARRSTMPILSGAAVVYIDIMRGLPLVGVLFVAVVLFPLFVPPGTEFNVLVRTLIAFTLFNAASMAEVIRGGIQSVPHGQREAAIALGLRPWQAMVFSIVPQALRAALPGIVNVSVSIIKETTIVLMAGMFDFLGVLQGALIDPEWNIGDQIRQTGYFFAGAVFFIICFGLSRYSARIERKLNVDNRL